MVLKYKTFLSFLQSLLACLSVFFLLLNVILPWARGYLLDECRSSQVPGTLLLATRLCFLPAVDLHGKSSLPFPWDSCLKQQWAGDPQVIATAPLGCARYLDKGSVRSLPFLSPAKPTVMLPAQKGDGHHHASPWDRGVCAFVCITLNLPLLLPRATGRLSGSQNTMDLGAEHLRTHPREAVGGRIVVEPGLQPPGICCIVSLDFTYKKLIQR